MHAIAFVDLAPRESWLGVPSLLKGMAFYTVTAGLHRTRI